MKTRIVFAAVCAACCLAGAAVSQQAQITVAPRAVSISTAQVGPERFILFRLNSDGTIDRRDISTAHVKSSFDKWEKLPDKQ